MDDETLLKILIINAKSSGGHIQLSDAYGSHEPTAVEQQQFRRVLDVLLAAGQVKKSAGGSWYLTTSAMSQKSDLSNLTMDPATVNLKAIPSTFHHD